MSKSRKKIEFNDIMGFQFDEKVTKTVSKSIKNSLKIIICIFFIIKASFQIYKSDLVENIKLEFPNKNP